MCVVEETVEDGVAEGGIADDIVPVFDGDLAGEERAAAGVAVVEDLEEVVPSLARERSEPPVVEDEEPRSGEALDELGIRPVAAGEGESRKRVVSWVAEFHCLSPWCRTRATTASSRSPRPSS